MIFLLYLYQIISVSKKMKIDAFITQYFVETEMLFKDTIVVMIDVLRAGTTICCALFNGAKEVIPVETTEKAVSIYSSLSRETRFLGGERNCIKPSGFDAGNSPTEYSESVVKHKSVILTTSNGTKLFLKAKHSKQRIIGSYVNIDSVLNHIKSINEENPCNITFLCAGNEGRLSYEDTLCAGAFIDELQKFYNDVEISDTAHAAMTLYRMFSDNLQNFIAETEHASKLRHLGFIEDIVLSLEWNKYPVVPVLSGGSIKLT